MATASEVAQKALHRILVEADEATLQDTEYADFYEVMNDFMADLEAKNINLGYTTVTAGTDTVTVPAGAIRGIITNCAIEAAPDYGGYVSQPLIESAKQGMRTLRKLGRTTIGVKYPVTLPKGAGNDDNASTYRDYHFYSLQDSALLSLSGNTEATDIVTQDVKVLVAGDWRVEAGKGFMGDINGQIQNVSGGELDMEAKVSLSATGNSTYTFTLLRNGAHAETTASSALTATPATVEFTKLVTMYPGDWLELWVEDDLATVDVTVVDCQFRLS
jgi:hypothetical protein